MKNILILIFCFVGAGIIYISLRPNIRINSTPQSSIPDATPSITPPEKLHTISFNNQTFAYEFVIGQAKSLILIPNFTEKKTSAEITESHACQYGINGGFYDTANKPLGGFKADSVVVKKPVNNRLIDGFIWKDKDSIHMTFTPPPENAVFYLQTGPVIRINSQKIPISIAEDELRRRNIFGITKSGSVVFLSLYNPESVYDGPFLGDLPAIIERINEKESFNLAEAVNLDGGSASAYISPSKRLQEFSPIGSFFCIQ